MKPPVYSIVEFSVREDTLSSARARMRKAERKARQEPGCLQFHFLQDLATPTAFTGYGMWATNSDMERHLQKLNSEHEAEISLANVLDPEVSPVLRRMDRV